MSSLDFCTTNDPATCWTVPAEFVRLRYFFGQRLGVIDLSDEQSYVVGKQRFHNLRAHGSGVLCGLALERYVYPAGAPPTTPTTVLLVRRGAALDACGREIIVGWDQCIDVAAWFQKHVASIPGLAKWQDPTYTGDRTLYVCLRYRECPTDPAPAPRDPCGCDVAGCEFGRVREGFELTLITADDLPTVMKRAMPSDPPPVPLESLGLDGAIRSHWNWMLSGPCPDPDVEPCLCLGSFTVAFTGASPTDLSTPDLGIAERISLLSTAMLQETLLGALVDAGNDAFIGPGPRITGLELAGSGADGGTLLLATTLVTDGAVTTPLAPAPAGPPASAFDVTLRRFRDDGTWEDATALVAPIVWNALNSRFELAIASGLVADARYRLEIAIDDTEPVVDMRMRPLGPRHITRHFRLVAQAGTLVVSPNLYDA